MAEFTPFIYGGFYDVPRCLSLSYKGQRLLLQSTFGEDIGEYTADYSVYILASSIENSWPACSPEFLRNTPMACIGQIPIDQVTFDSSKRKELDASILDRLIAA